MDIAGHYSVPITRRAGFTESSIPPEYRDRTHMTEQNHVRCGLFAGDNLVQVTWTGPDEVSLRNMRPGDPNVTFVGTIPSGEGVRSRTFRVPATSDQDYVWAVFGTTASEVGTDRGAITVTGLGALTT